MTRTEMQPFEKDDLVRLRPEFADIIESKRGRFGIVTGFGRDPGMVRVLRHGTKQPETWAAKFWEIDI